MLTRKEELIAKLDELIKLEGWKETASDIGISLAVNQLDRLGDKFPESLQKAFDALANGIIDGEYDKDSETLADGGETPPQEPPKPPKT